MIDLVYWSFLAALLPIVLHVCVRILSLVYWSLRAAPWPIVLHGREIPVRLPKERKKKMEAHVGKLVVCSNRSTILWCYDAAVQNGRPAAVGTAPDPNRSVPSIARLISPTPLSVSSRRDRHDPSNREITMLFQYIHAIILK